MFRFTIRDVLWLMVDGNLTQSTSGLLLSVDGNDAPLIPHN
jgi:hypothetical protein